jgi:hypothetical protein
MHLAFLTKSRNSLSTRVFGGVDVFFTCSITAYILIFFMLLIPLGLFVVFRAWIQGIVNIILFATLSIAKSSTHNSRADETGLRIYFSVNLTLIIRLFQALSALSY